MSYTPTKNAVIKVEYILKDLLNAQDDCAFGSLEPQKLAYHIHEAMASVNVLEEYTQYRGLKDKFRFRVRQGKVVAELKGKPVDAFRLVQETLSKMRIDEVDNVVGIIGACLANKVTEIYFPSAVLREDDLRTLLTWTEDTSWYIINHDEAGVTLTKTNPGELAWSPNGNHDS